MDALGPPLRAAAMTVFIAGLIWLLVDPPSFAGIGDLAKIIIGAVLIVIATAWLTVQLTGEEMPEPEFRRLAERSDTLATLPPPDRAPTEFDELVANALDELPEEFREVLAGLPVTVSRRGHEFGAYGHYIGDTVSREGYPDHIVIYQDTLERDFGHDPVLLRGQVQRTVRHEIAHHLGWDERGVRDLGL